jgi:hypothetical protein
VCDIRRIDHPGSFEFDLLSLEVIEQPDTVTEQQRRDVNLELVQKSSPDELLNGIRAAADADILGTCGHSGFVESTLDTVVPAESAPTSAAS